MIPNYNPNDDFEDLNDGIIALMLIICVGLFAIGGILYWLLTL